MGLVSGLGENAVKDVLAQVPGLEAYLQAREDDFLARIQPTIDEIKETVASVKADVDAVGKTVVTVNATLVPEVVKLVELGEAFLLKVENASRAFGAAMAAK